MCLKAYKNIMKKLIFSIFVVKMVRNPKNQSKVTVGTMVFDDGLGSAKRNMTPKERCCQRI